MRLSSKITATRPRSDFVCQLLIAIGLAIAISGVVLHMALPAKYERIELIPLFVGFGLALFGAAWLDPNRAKDSANIVADTGGKIVHSIVELRTGERGDQTNVRIEKTSDPAKPEQPAEVKVSVTSDGATPTVALPVDHLAAEPAAAPALANPVAWKDGHHEDGVL